MPEIYAKDLDLNLLRVFAVVAQTGSVTAAANQLYLTQPAVSAALRRLTSGIGAQLFVRQGRGLSLTSRGVRLRKAVEEHLGALIDAALEPPPFDPKTSTRSLRLGLSDAVEVWLLPELLRVFARNAPGLRIISVPVQFRSVEAALEAGLDAAVTVADELPASILRQSLYESRFLCLFDPRKTRISKLTLKQYFAHQHVIVSYAGDLRGVVEDATGRTRNIRCSVSSFAHLGPILSGSSLLATVPEIVAAQILGGYPHLRTAPLPLRLAAGSVELLWPRATDDDEACAFARRAIVAIAQKSMRAAQ